MFSETMGQPGERAANTAQGRIEKRRHERLQTHMHGQMQLNDGVREVEMIDMSKSGAQLKICSGTMPTKGQIIDLALVWPCSPDSPALHVQAIIVRVEGDRIGIQFGHVKGASAH